MLKSHEKAHANSHGQFSLASGNVRHGQIMYVRNPAPTASPPTVPAGGQMTVSIDRNRS